MSKYCILFELLLATDQKNEAALHLESCQNCRQAQAERKATEIAYVLKRMSAKDLEQVAGDLFERAANTIASTLLVVLDPLSEVDVPVLIGQLEKVIALQMQCPSILKGATGSVKALLLRKTVAELVVHLPTEKQEQLRAWAAEQEKIV